MIFDPPGCSGSHLRGRRRGAATAGKQPARRGNEGHAGKLHLAAALAASSPEDHVTKLHLAAAEAASSPSSTHRVTSSTMPSRMSQQPPAAFSALTSSKRYSRRRAVESPSRSWQCSCGGQEPGALSRWGARPRDGQGCSNHSLALPPTQRQGSSARSPTPPAPTSRLRSPRCCAAASSCGSRCTPNAGGGRPRASASRKMSTLRQGGGGGSKTNGKGALVQQACSAARAAPQNNTQAMHTALAIVPPACVPLAQLPATSSRASVCRQRKGLACQR